MLSWLAGSSAPPPPPPDTGSDSPASPDAGGSECSGDSWADPPPTGTWEFVVRSRCRSYDIVEGEDGLVWQQRLGDDDAGVLRCAIEAASQVAGRGIPAPALFDADYAVVLPSGAVLWLKRSGVATLESLFQQRPAGGHDGERAVATCVERLRRAVRELREADYKSAAVAAVARTFERDTDEAILASPHPEDSVMSLMYNAKHERPPEPPVPPAHWLSPLPAPWWADPPTTPDAVCPSLPAPLRRARISFSGQLWRPGGWVRVAWEAVWVVLWEGSVFISRSATVKPETVLPLAEAEVGVPKGSMQGPGGRPVHGLTVGGVTLCAASESEREQWAARLSAAALQVRPDRIAGTPQRAWLAAELLHSPTRPLAPCIGPDTVAAASDTIHAGFVVTQVPDSRRWVQEGWRRRWVSVHRGWVGVRADKGDWGGAAVVPLRHARVTMKDERTAALTGPFLEGSEVLLWFDSAHQEDRWLAAVDLAVAASNPERGAAAAGKLRPSAVAAEDAAQHALWRKPFLVQHGLDRAKPGLFPQTADAIATSPEAASAQWRAHASPDGVCGPPDAAGWVATDGLEWRWAGTGEAPAAPCAPPRHTASPVSVAEAVQRFKAGYGLRGRLPGGGNAAQTRRMLSGTAVDRAASAADAATAPLLEPTHLTLTCLPKHAQVALHEDSSAVWLLQGAGRTRLVLFGDECVGLRGDDWGSQTSPHALRSRFTGAVPSDWEAPGSPLANLGGVEVVLPPGAGLYIPAGVWYTLRSEDEWAVVLAARCGGAAATERGPAPADADL